MKNGRMDASIFSFKPHRKAFLVYSKEPLFRESYVPFVRANSGIEIKKISDFDKLRVGHLNGLTYSREFFAYIEQRRNNKTLESGDVIELPDGAFSPGIILAVILSTLLPLLSLTSAL